MAEGRVHERILVLQGLQPLTRPPCTIPLFSCSPRRRQVWDLISSVKRERVVVLTTHSMEEADVLGDRIGIIAAGQLRCLGTSLVSPVKSMGRAGKRREWERGE